MNILGASLQPLCPEGLDNEYCDDFQCTSSPAIEQTVRSFARDLKRKKYTPALFSKAVKFTVGRERGS